MRCRYFDNGYCQYGDKCRNEHVQDSSHPSTRSSVFGNNVSASNTATQGTKNLSVFGQLPSNVPPADSVSSFDKLKAGDNNSTITSSGTSQTVPKNMEAEEKEETDSIARPNDTKMMFGKAVENAADYDIKRNTFSKSADLSKTELEAFANDTFSFGCIPTKPPPIDLCH